MQLTLTTAGGDILWIERHAHMLDLTKAIDRALLTEEIRIAMERAKAEATGLEPWKIK